MRVLFLTLRMARGFGVDVVVAAYARGLTRAGIECRILCVDSDGTWTDLSIATCIPELRVVEAIVDDWQPTHVIAHSEPFMSIVARLPQGRFHRWVWEHGDPTPELIPSEVTERTRVRTAKRTDVYPKVDRVFAISAFIRDDIGWPAAIMIPNGGDHLPSLPPKEPAELSGRFEVCSLMRLGWRDQEYKGAGALLALQALAKRRGNDWGFSVAGRGEPRHVREFVAQGFRVALNLSEKDKCEFFRRAKVFVSPSLWEGFNLPLIEAQRAGTLGVAFDTSVHPETTPFVFGNLYEMCTYLERLDRDRDTLRLHSHRAQAFVDRLFRWERSVAALQRQLTDGAGGVASSQPTKSSAFRLVCIGVREGIRGRGIFRFSIWFAKWMLKKIFARRG